MGFPGRDRIQAPGAGRPDSRTRRSDEKRDRCPSEATIPQCHYRGNEFDPGVSLTSSRRSFSWRPSSWRLSWRPSSWQPSSSLPQSYPPKKSLGDWSLATTAKGVFKTVAPQKNLPTFQAGMTCRARKSESMRSMRNPFNVRRSMTVEASCGPDGRINTNLGKLCNTFFAFFRNFDPCASRAKRVAGRLRAVPLHAPCAVQARCVSPLPARRRRWRRRCGA